MAAGKRLEVYCHEGGHIAPRLVRPVYAEGYVVVRCELHGVSFRTRQGRWETLVRKILQAGHTSVSTAYLPTVQAPPARRVELVS